MTYEIDGVVISSTETLTTTIAREYVKRAIELNPRNNVERIDLVFDGDDVDIITTLSAKKFERVRRITGYLVGELDRFNDAKREEVEDRVKHLVESL